MILIYSQSKYDAGPVRFSKYVFIAFKNILFTPIFMSTTFCVYILGLVRPTLFTFMPNSPITVCIGRGHN